MNEPPKMTHIRLDDIPLLLGVLKQMGIAEHYQQEIGDHGLHQGLSGGWMLTVWLAFVLSQADHTKYKVEGWVERNQALLAALTGQPIQSSEFNDNRLTSLLTRLSQGERWENFEAALWQHSVEVYQLSEPSVGELDSAHVDSTTAYGYHEVQPEGLMQRGYSKDRRPELPQLKLMTVAIYPHGHLSATQVVSGNTADEGLYLPIIARVRKMTGKSGVLYAGDTKMAPLATRAETAYWGDYYLTVAPRRGEIGQLLPAWIEAALSGAQATTSLVNESEEEIGYGYEFRRSQSAQLELVPGGELIDFSWDERVQVIRTDSLAQTESAKLEKRLERAQAQLRALTPQPGRGRRQYRDQESFLAAVQEILERHQVGGLLRVGWEIKEQSETRYLGPGRGGQNRLKQTTARPRFCVTEVEGDQEAIAAACARLGWRVQLSNAPEKISLQTCVLHYRSNWRGERNYHRLKARPIGLDPLFVHNDDQIIGLTYLLTLAVRVETLIEYQVACGLKKENKQMKGLYSGLPQKATATPTAVAMLSAISRAEITLTQLEWHGETTIHVTPLPELLLDVLRYLHLPLELYTGQKPYSAFDISIFGK
jgi:transposase